MTADEIRDAYPNVVRMCDQTSTIEVSINNPHIYCIFGALAMALGHRHPFVPSRDAAEYLVEANFWLDPIGNDRTLAGYYVVAVRMLFERAEYDRAWQMLDEALNYHPDKTLSLPG